MKELIPINEHGLFADTQAVARVHSRFVATEFGKRHDSVLRDIKNLDCSEEFNLHNFVEITYRDDRGRRQPAYAMTRDGFTFLVMGYRGRKAAQFKEAYIKRFNEMEAVIAQVMAARMEHPRLTDNIKALYEEPKPYHYSNEADMFNRIVLGMSAQEYRLTHGLQKGESIRPYLSVREIMLIERLQHADVGLTLAVRDFQERKRILSEYKERLESELLAAQCS